MFNFKQFSIDDSACAMKVGTDSVLLGAWTDTGGVRSVIDVGTGSGILALMIAQRAEDADIIALELDPAAAAAAAANMAASPWAGRCHAICIDAAGYHPSTRPDLIICNPPYFTGALTAPDRHRTTARHANGTLTPLSVISMADRWLSASGSLAMVTPADIADTIVFEAEMHRMDIWRRCLVSTNAGRPATRILWQLSRKGTRTPQPDTHIDVRSCGTPTEAYRTLTADFYLHLR